MKESGILIMGKKSKKLYLIDGQGLIYRAFFALPKLTTTYGQLINAAYGFALVLMRLLQEKKPDGIIVAFDTPKPTFRHKKYAKYKAQREKMPQELIDQLPIIKEIVNKLNIPSIEIEGYEADDIIGSIVDQTKKSDYKPVIVSGDRDLLQLVDEETEIILMQKGISKVKEYQFESAKEMLGFSPNLIPDYIGLKGDTSDNIPGIPGIGEKTAKNLLQLLGNLENIIENKQQIKKTSLRNKIEEYQEQALLSKDLAVISRNINLNLKFDSLSHNRPDYAQLRELFQQYEFKKLLERIPEAGIEDKDIKKNELVIHQVNNDRELESLGRSILSENMFSFLFIIKQTNKIHDYHKFDGVVFALKNEVFLVKIDTNDKLIAKKESISIEKINNFLFSLFQNEKIEKIGFDLKSIWVCLCDNGFFLKYPYFDIKIAAYLLNPSQQEYSLTKLIDLYLESANIAYSCQNLSGRGISEEEKNICNQARLLVSLKNTLWDQLRKNHMDRLYRNIELPLIRVIYQMEKTGIKLDTAFLKEMSQQFAKKIEGIRSEIFKMAGEKFNLNSPKQLSCILFQKLNLPTVKKIKTGYSTNAQVLHKLSEKHEIVAKILSYREMEKLKNTYIDKLPKLINPRSGRIHTSFNQTGTSTGRLSSNNPNLQNIPIRTELGRAIRNAFIAEKGNIYLSADYSQIELRILAHLSQDQKLLDAFSQGEDIHAYTASQIFNVEQNIVSGEMRRIAKTINFGIIYGMSSYGLVNNLGISSEDAKNYIEAYFQKYHKVQQFIESQIASARKNKYVITMLNRIRYLEGIDSPNKNIREFYERTAINTPIQGTAADLIKIAMIRINQDIESKGISSGLILQIHDELIFEIPESELESRSLLVKKIMENSLSLSLPIIVNFKTGYRWGDLE
ncbi:MAG: DNA polymerase I [Atribacterota bacterium]